MRYYVIIGLLIAALTSGCNWNTSYDVQGRVVGFGDDERTVIVEHEEIPGYMRAMTMSFKAADPSALSELDTGDAIGFVYEVRRDSSWIRDVRRLPDDAIAEHPAGERLPQPVSANETVILQPGDPVDTFELVTQDEAPLTPEHLAGKAYVVTFIYTRCPMPEFCPLMSERFQQLQPRLRDAFGDQVRLLSVSIDPEHDTPEVLRDYAAQLDADTDRWIFATGTSEQVERVAEMFGVSYREDNRSDEIMHNLSTAVVDAEGRVVEIWRGNDWTPDEVLQVLQSTLTDVN